MILAHSLWASKPVGKINLIASILIVLMFGWSCIDSGVRAHWRTRTLRHVEGPQSEAELRATDAHSFASSRPSDDD